MIIVLERGATEEQIRDAPDINSMTEALSKDAAAGADYRTKATLAHNNYRADPELIRHHKGMVIAVRRIACACDGCKAALARPVATRYTPYDTCERFACFGAETIEAFAHEKRAQYDGREKRNERNSELRAVNQQRAEDGRRNEHRNECGRDRVGEEVLDQLDVVGGHRHEITGAPSH